MIKIKFRAWDKLGKKMLYSKMFSEKGATIKSFLAFEAPKGYSKVCDEIGYMGWNEIDLVIMQYTGLKDKNGVPIFEGDIIKYEGAVYESMVKEIIYSDDDAYYTIGRSEHPLILCKTTIDVGWEVIGNIYENKELIVK